MTRAEAKVIALERARKIEHITICKCQIGEDFEMFEFAIVSTPVVARTKKLRARWTADLNQEMEVIQAAP